MKPPVPPLKIRRWTPYLLPNFLTSINLMAGFFAITLCLHRRFSLAVWAILLAAIMDGLDGMAARFTGGTSRFGLEYDSMADLVSFGLAPSLLMYQWHLERYHRVGWAAAFLFMACGALRLARFNVQSGDIQKYRFLGIPIPMAACQVVTTYLILNELRVAPKSAGIIVLVTAYLIAFLMISNCPYRSLKGIQVPRRYSFYVPVLFILTAAVIWMFPQVSLWIISTTYILSGPIELFIRRFIMRPPADPSSTPLHASKEAAGEHP